MLLSVSSPAPIIIWVVCPAGAKLLSVLFPVIAVLLPDAPPPGAMCSGIEVLSEPEDITPADPAPR